MEITEKDCGDWKVLCPVIKRLDAHAAQEFKTALSAVLNAGTHNLLLDLSKVDFVDSSGLGAIVHGYNSVRDTGRFVLASAQPAVVSLLKLTQLDKVLTVVDTPETILETV